MDLRRISYNNLTNLKAYWGLSKAAIIRKAKDCGYINENTYRYLNIELGRRGEKKTETGFVDIDQPTTLPQIINLMESELGYSDYDVAETLRISVSDYLRLFKPETSRQLRFAG